MSSDAGDEREERPGDDEEARGRASEPGAAHTPEGMPGGPEYAADRSKVEGDEVAGAPAH